MKREWLMTALVATAVFPASAALAANPEAAQFTTSDGVKITGDYWRVDGGSAPAVILLHMEKSDRQSWKPLVPVLNDSGFAVLAIDLRGHGQSVPEGDDSLRGRVERGDQRVFKAMHRDVSAAYSWLAGQPGIDLARIGVVGAGAGGAVALDYAVRDKSIDAVVLMTPPREMFGLDCVANIARYGERSLLMLTSGEDRNTGADDLAAAAPGAELKVFNATGIRGTAMLGKVDQVEQRIAEYLESAVGPVSNQTVCASLTSEVYHTPDSPSGRSIKAENRRLFSSPSEAESRGYRAARGPQKKSPDPESKETQEDKEDS